MKAKCFKASQPAIQPMSKEKKNLYLIDRCIKKKAINLSKQKKINFPQQLCENEINKCFT